MNLIKLIENTIREFIILEATADEIKNIYYPNIPQNIFNAIVSTDTVTSNINNGKVGKYAKWLLKIYKLGNLELRNLDKVKKCIITYDKMLKSKKSEINHDINQYESLEDMCYDVKNYIGDDKIISKTDKEKIIKKQSKVIYTDDRFIVIEPFTKDASCYYGRGTELCTSSHTADNRFDTYIERGSIYFIFDKSKRNKMGDYFKYLIHLNDSEYKDQNNKNINFYKNIEIKELVKKIIKIVNIDHNELIKRSSDNIKFIDNPDEIIQMKAIELNPFSIEFIDNPTEKVISKAISLNPEIKKLINTSYDEKREYKIKHYKSLLDLGYITQNEYDDYINYLS
jgi:hypothetical protein